MCDLGHTNKTLEWSCSLSVDTVERTLCITADSSMKPHQAVTTETQACKTTTANRLYLNYFALKSKIFTFIYSRKLRRWFSFSCVCLCIYEESFVCPQTHSRPTRSQDHQGSHHSPWKCDTESTVGGFLLVERIIDGLAVALTHQVLHPAGESFHTLCFLIIEDLHLLSWLLSLSIILLPELLNRPILISVSITAQSSEFMRHAGGCTLTSGWGTSLISTVW